MWEQKPRGPNEQSVARAHTRSSFFLAWSLVLLGSVAPGGCGPTAGLGGSGGGTGDETGTSGGTGGTTDPCADDPCCGAPCCAEVGRWGARCSPPIECFQDDDCGFGQICVAETCEPIPALSGCTDGPAWNEAPDLGIPAVEDAIAVWAAGQGRELLIQTQGGANLELRQVGDLVPLSDPVPGQGWPTDLVRLFDLDGDGLRDLLWFGTVPDAGGTLLSVALGTDEVPAAAYGPWSDFFPLNDQVLGAFERDGAQPELLVVTVDGWKRLRIDSEGLLFEVEQGSFSNPAASVARVGEGLSTTPCSGCVLLARSERFTADARLFALLAAGYDDLGLRLPGGSPGRRLASDPSVQPALLASPWQVSDPGVGAGETEARVGVTVGVEGPVAQHAVALAPPGRSYEAGAAVLSTAAKAPLGVAVAGESGATVVVLRADGSEAGTPLCEGPLFEGVAARSLAVFDSGETGARDGIAVVDANGNLRQFMPAP